MCTAKPSVPICRSGVGFGAARDGRRKRESVYLAVQVNAFAVFVNACLDDSVHKGRLHALGPELCLREQQETYRLQAVQRPRETPVS